LARVRRQRLDVAALAFGVDGVERQRGLAGAGQARDHDQLVARQVEIDVLEVVRPRTADADEFHRHRGACRGRVAVVGRRTTDEPIGRDKWGQIRKTEPAPSPGITKSGPHEAGRGVRAGGQFYGARLNRVGPVPVPPAVSISAGLMPLRISCTLSASARWRARFSSPSPPPVSSSRVSPAEALIASAIRPMASRLPGAMRALPGSKAIVT